MEAVPPVMLVTGGSRGIGAATARLAAARGYAVAVSYLTGEELAADLVRELQATGVRATACRADVSRECDVEHLFGHVERELGAVTALVNNAGVLEVQCRVEDIDLARLQRVFSVNVFGSFLCAKAAIRRMSPAAGGAGGAIVNVSSMAARLGSPNEYVDYAAAKGAIDTFTIGLAKEVGPQGIRVNAVRPGLIHTEIHARGGEPNRIARLQGGVPLQRGGQAEEVANAILWLLSPEASYVTGACLDISGGR